MLKAWLTLLFTATFVLSPLVADPFSGFSADQLPQPQTDPPVQPAGWAFSIWGVIYLWLVISALYGVIRRGDDPVWDWARGPLILSLALGTPWLAVANASAIWATLLILPMAVTAVWALLRAPEDDRWWFAYPVGLYAGWLTAASFVSLGTTLAGYGIGLDATGWAYVCVALAFVTAWAVQRRAPLVPAYGLAVVWALAGVVAQNMEDPLGVSILAGAGAVLLALLLIGQMRRAPA